MATNIPPHNLREVIAAVVKIIDDQIEDKEETTIEEILQIIKDLTSRRVQKSLVQEVLKKHTEQVVERFVCVQLPILSRCRMEKTGLL